MRDDIRCNGDELGYTEMDDYSVEETEDVWKEENKGKGRFLID